MNVGAMRHRVRVERLVEPSARSPVGEPVREWALVVERWASIEPISGRELFAADQVGGEVTTRVRLRHVPGMTSTTRWRIVHRGLVHDVVTVVNPSTRDEELELLCRAGVTSG